MTPEGCLFAGLNRMRQATVALVAGFGETGHSGQFHADLSPPGWHLGHTAFVERYWLREIILEEVSCPASHALYFPENNEKASRAHCIPDWPALIREVAERHRDSRLLLQSPPRRMAGHPLYQDGYIVRFLYQHYAQHVETLRMVQQAARLAGTSQSSCPTVPGPMIRKPAAHWLELAGGTRCIGGEGQACYDNELPAHAVPVGPCRIARSPVSNGQFATFMADGGYTRTELWSEEGWAWRAAHGITAPYHWRHDGGVWHSVSPAGTRPVDAEQPISGISWYEADAYARWAGARLPHEYEWEAARREGRLKGVGQVWEWCANAFHPYPGFRPFPYEGYSLPWFDGQHYVLRGGSHVTEPDLKRASFRNFYEPGKRHIFAGMRLARDVL